MDKATFLELMDKYIDGTMSSTEKYEFEQMLHKDPLLQQDFDLHLAIRKGIKKSARIDFLDELKDIKKEIHPKKDNIKSLFPKWKIMGIAAAMVAIVASLFLFKNDKHISPQSYYAGNLEIKVLPKEGKFGGVSKESIHVLIKTGIVLEYELTKDSLILYADPGFFDKFKIMDPIITLNQQRNIEVEIKSKKYLFKLKNDNE